jgi:hypothetical protein
MSEPVKLPAIFSGIRSRKDKSYSLSFDTRELGGTDAGILLGMNGTECWLLIAPDDSLDSVDVPRAKPDSGTNQKTPGQRLRAVLFVLWTQSGKPGEYEDFYRIKLERVIDTIKGRLDAGDML